MRAALEAGADPSQDTRGLCIAEYLISATCPGWKTPTLRDAELTRRIAAGLRQRHAYGFLDERRLKIALFRAVDDRRGPEVVQTLIDAGGAAAIRDDPELAPRLLIGHSDGGRAEVIPVLVAGGCDIKAKSAWGRTVLSSAAAVFSRWRTDSQLQEFQAVLHAGADVHAADLCGETTLLLAARAGSPVVLPLLRAGADATAANCIGETPFSFAARQRSRRVVAALVRRTMWCRRRHLLLMLRARVLPRDVGIG